MGKRYYTLCLRDDGHPWRPEFGAYSRSKVHAEMQAYTDYDYKSCNARIIVSGDTQAEIDAAVAELNREAV